MNKLLGFGTTAMMLGTVAAVVACSSTSRTVEPLPDGGPPEGGMPEAGPDATDDAGDAGDGGAVTCAEYATAYCTQVNLCTPGDLQSQYGTVAQCEAQRTADCVRNSAVSTTGLTQAFLDACTPTLVSRAAACMKGPVVGPVGTPSDPCNVVGKVSDGDPCGVDAECASDACNRDGRLCGTCAIQGMAGMGCGLATGVQCSPGLSCSTATNLCVPTVAVGGTCDLGITGQCQVGSTCLRMSATSTGGTCTADAVGVGTACNPDGIGLARCSNPAGYFCDGTDHCAAIQYATPTSTCSVSSTALIECKDGACVSGTCTPYIAMGQPCTLDAAPGCVDGTTCVASGATATCQPVSPTCSMATVAANFTFQPSNVSLSAIDAAVAAAADENVSGTSCTITTGTTAATMNAGCFNSSMTAVPQTGGPTLNLIVVRSLTVQPGAFVTVNGTQPLVIVSLSDIAWSGQLAANGVGYDQPGPGGANNDSVQNAAGPTPGGGPAGSATAVVGGGGASFCGIGGPGGGTTMTAIGYGTPDLRPLFGGAAGGSGGEQGGGSGGGGIQLVAAGSLVLSSGGSLFVGGGGGGYGGAGLEGIDNANGGGSGGAILLEAQTVTVDGTLAANGGGGGGDPSLVAQDGLDSATPAAGGGSASVYRGGAGSAGATPNGKPGVVQTGSSAPGAGGGGGGAGRIRINTTSAKVGGSMAVYSPAKGACTVFGTVRALGSGQ